VNSYEGVVCVTCGHHPAPVNHKPRLDPNVLAFFGMESQQPGMLFKQSKN
jgi:hypothetical protein